MIVLDVPIQIKLVSTLAVIRVNGMYLEKLNVLSYSQLSIVDIFMCLISRSDVLKYFL